MKQSLQRIYRALGPALPRGVALFLGAFCLLNLLGGQLRDNFNSNLWWIDLRSLPHGLANILLLISAIAMLAYAWRPPRAHVRYWLTLFCLGLLAVAGGVNAFRFYVLLASHSVASSLPISFSLLLTGMLVLMMRAVCRSRQNPAPPAHPAWIGLTTLACLGIFPVAQMLCFGKTDYRRQADVAIVLGAHVYQDGRLSDALSDRVKTACQLYRDGYVHRLIFSGGPGDGEISEPTAMKRRAIQLGVRADDIILDEAGLNTRATAVNCEAKLKKIGASRVLVVSHAYHLPRVKLAFQQQGREVYTVPAKETYLLGRMPVFMAREVAALWVYYLHPLWHDGRPAADFIKRPASAQFSPPASRSFPACSPLAAGELQRLWTTAAPGQSGA